MFKKILFATDGSPASEHAAQMAIDLARIHGGSLIVVCAIDPYPYMGGGDMNLVGLETYMESGRTMAEKAFVSIKHMAQQDGAPVEVETRLIEKASAYKAILMVADDNHVDLIIVGSHGYGGFDRLIMGSVASKVALHSTHPVLVIR